MDRKHNKKNIPFAQQLRKNMTKEERHLWYDFLKSYPVKFLRQKTIGKYIVDFYCAEAQLVIELDGSQHFCDDNIDKDNERTAYLKEYGLTVIRIPNNEMFTHFDRVCEYIDRMVKRSLTPTIPPSRLSPRHLPLHKGGAPLTRLNHPTLVFYTIRERSGERYGGTDDSPGETDRSRFG